VAHSFATSTVVMKKKRYRIAIGTRRRSSSSMATVCSAAARSSQVNNSHQYSTKLGAPAASAAIEKNELPKMFMIGHAIASNNIDCSDSQVANRFRGAKKAAECFLRACRMPRVQRYRCFNN
jgi:hypothetical protein